jgi:CRISPR-associated endonuclease Cas1
MPNNKFLINYVNFIKNRNGLESAKQIIKTKIQNQISLLKNKTFYFSKTEASKSAYLKYAIKSLNEYLVGAKNIKTRKELFLFEAKASKIYWRGINAILSKRKILFKRKIKSKDIYNQLLNIGYHFLAGKITSILFENFVYPEIGLLHQRPRNKALVYDFMELYRQLVVDKAFLSFLNKKKGGLKMIKPADVKYFVKLCKENLDKKYYLNSLKYCPSLKEIIKIDINKFKKAIRTKDLFLPTKISWRHENRCKQKTAPPWAKRS